MSLLSLGIFLCGCTCVRVERVSTDASRHSHGPVGQRFALPVVAFVVTPTGEGGISVERSDLPDPANTFAIDGDALFAAYSLNVETKNGVLTQVRWNPDSTAVLGQTLASAGGLASEAIKASRTAEDSKDSAIAAAKMDVVVAQAAYDKTLKEYGLGSKEEKEAKVALAKAKAKLALLTGNDATAVLNDLANVSNDAAGKAALDRFSKAPAPMLLVLHVDKDGRPSLKPARTEAGDFQLRTPIAGTKPAATTDTAVVVPTDKARITIKKPASGDFTAEIELSAKVAAATTQDLRDTQTGIEHTARAKGLVVKTGAADHLILTLDSGLPTGVYQYRFNVTATAGAAPVLLTVTLDVK
ncbi:MAG TPA: hypothetical protein VN634_04205 [Candidatus Limnocylindrales bacterium]|nr:hypothetical protein [Candidatus Limnocylindrales bacterium]